MLAHGRPLGVFTLTFSEPRRFGAEERHFISFIATKYGQALERARLYEAERAVRAKAEQAYEAEKAARSRAEAAEEEATRVGALQEQLVAVVSHDLRNPLGAIIAATDMLRKRRRNMESWEKSAVALIARSAGRMQGIIAGALDLARTRRGASIQVHREPVRLADVCRQAIAELEHARPGRAIQLSVERDDEGEWDPGRLAQLVSNLAANALQHSPSDATVEVRIRGSQQNLVLEVHDSGPPIPPHVLATVFEPFVKGASSTDAPTANVGLGLYIVREIARAHQGAVDVCSRAGHGTSFVVKLPRRPPAGTAHAGLQ